MLNAILRSFAGVAAVVVASGALAGPDGRTGPTPFTGAALDRALSDMNAQLQARYAQD